MSGTNRLPTLLAIMARLRDPAGGCPWDREQNFATIAPYTIEEAYEVAEAIAANDMGALKDELGDLLFQVVFHARMAEEQGAFAFDDVVGAIADKMVRRHPHVFADTAIADAAAQSIAWEEHKAAERRKKSGERPASALDGVGIALPALTRAEKIQKRAARVGFDWKDAAPIFDKIAEETVELRAEIERGSASGIAEEVGDLLFAVANLARHLDVDPETALRDATRKFERRFRRVETLLAVEGKAPADSTLDEMETRWRQAKDEGL